MLPLILACVISAQSQPHVIEDFEDGMVGWTLSGNCWRGNDAFDGAAYNARSSLKFEAFQGKAFALTFMRSNAETGTARSAPFEISSPAISFLIVGGQEEAQLTFKLVVDGRAVLSATGDNSLYFRRKVWDVTEWRGKTAHFELSDQSNAASFGFIGVDDIRTSQGNVSAPFDGPELEYPVRVIQVLDRNGQGGFYDIQKPMNYSIAKRLVQETNYWTMSAGIRLTLAESNFETRRDDYLNLDCDPPSSNAVYTNPSVKPTSTGVRERLQAFQKISDASPKVITIFVHRGSEWVWDAKLLRWKFDLGFSHGGPGIKPGPKGYYLRLVGARPGVLAHEVGHSLGLNHTFRGDILSGPRMGNNDDVSQLIQTYISKTGDSANPGAALDGDAERGVFDTLPDPGPTYWRGLKYRTARIPINLSGRQPFELSVSHDNIMGDNQSTKPFTKDQVAMMRKTLQAWLKGNN